jgi:hypothetical protein
MGIPKGANSMNNNGILKHFVVKIRDKSDLKVLEEFKKVAVYNEKSYADAFIDAAKEYLEKNSPKKITLLTETELREKVDKGEVKSSDSSIKRYKRYSVLTRLGREYYRRNPENRIVYIWENMKKFLRDKEKNPYRRLSTYGK